MEKEEVQIGDQNIHAVHIKPDQSGDKPPLVFIHMSWGGSWAFSMYMEFFAKHGWDCYALDLRGHGKSGSTVAGAKMGDYVQDVRSVVEHFNLESPIIIGHSMGGLVGLMYGKAYPTSAIVSIDGSPSAQVQGKGAEVVYPEEYTPMDAGMPSDPMEIMKAFPDLTQEQLMNLKQMLGKESGVARSERKLGISIPKESLSVPLLFVGAELGTSVSFGIGIEKARKQAEYYGAEAIEVKGASHPGILIGKHWQDSAQAIQNWLEKV